MGAFIESMLHSEVDTVRYSLSEQRDLFSPTRSSTCRVTCIHSALFTTNTTAKDHLSVHTVPLLFSRSHQEEEHRYVPIHLISGASLSVDARHASICFPQLSCPAHDKKTAIRSFNASLCMRRSGMLGAGTEREMERETDAGPPCMHAQPAFFLIPHPPMLMRTARQMLFHNFVMYLMHAI